MMTLDELAKVLGGVVRIADGRRWLDTTVGELRAVVIRRVGPVSSAVAFDLAVFTPHTRELDPFHPHPDEWHLDGMRAIPRLRYGYVFAGCPGGVLYAASMAVPSIEGVVGALWDLADLARRPWVPPEDVDWSQRARRQRRQRMIMRLGFAAAVSLLVALIRRR
jgi:hypothetical protein